MCEVLQTAETACSGVILVSGAQVDADAQISAPREAGCLHHKLEVALFEEPNSIGFGLDDVGFEVGVLLLQRVVLDELDLWFSEGGVGMLKVGEPS